MDFVGVSDGGAPPNLMSGMTYDGTVYTILVIVISTIIFVTIVAIYDVIKAFINYYYVARQNKSMHYKKKKRKERYRQARDGLLSSVIFAALTIVTSIVLVPILASNLHNRKH